MEVLSHDRLGIGFESQCIFSKRIPRNMVYNRIKRKNEVLGVRVLLVEDEVRLAEAIARILEGFHYAVDWVTNGLEAEDMAMTGAYGVIILDRMLPGKEGVEVLKALRARRVDTPVILVTARDAVPDRVEGLEAGADDYLVKPFAKDELLARVNALARRSGTIADAEALCVGALKLDAKRCEAELAGERIRLSVKESQLLELLMRNKGQVLTKEQIFERVWGIGSDAELAAVELYVFYLRKKIDFARCDAVLQTVRGVGYCLKEVSA